MHYVGIYATIMQAKKKKNSWNKNIYANAMRFHNMNIRRNQKFMFCKDRGKDFSVWLMVIQQIRAWFVRLARLWISILPPGTFGNFHFTTRHFLGFSLYHLALLGISLNRPLDGKRTLSNALTTIENQTFGASVIKNNISFILAFSSHFIFSLIPHVCEK